MGSLLGWASLYALPETLPAFAAVLGVCLWVACWSSTHAELALGVHDDPRIIIDEVLGYWVSVALLPRSAAVLAAGLVLFRLLDSVKLPPYRWLERLPGGYGVVFDDVGAGVAANLLLHAGLHFGFLAA